MQTIQPRQVGAAVMMAVVCAIAACSVPSPPTAPSGPSALQIQGTTLLMIGGRGQLMALESTEDGLRRVPATWTAEGDAVAVTSSGAVVGKAHGRTIVRAHYGDRAGETTVHVVPGVAGTWRGSITVVDCWQTVRTDPDPCAGRLGVSGPLVLTVTQSASADQFDNLRATVDVFTPPAVGSFVGALDSTGLFFLDGHIERVADGLAGGVEFRWQLDGDRLVPSTLHPLGDDKIDVALSIREGPLSTTVLQLWQVSSVTR